MRRLNLILSIALFNVCTLLAVPAHKGAVKVNQPDGSSVTLRLHGDEWLSFNTTTDGYSVVKNEAGYYVYARLEGGQLTATAQVAHDADRRSATEQAFLAGQAKYQAPDMRPQVKQMYDAEMSNRSKARAPQRASRYDYNNFRGLVILVEYNDKKFSRTDYHDIMVDMFNKENYTGYRSTTGQRVQYTGSVRDYFSDNSAGKFKPQFDVYGPYSVDYSQYDAQGTSNATAILTAAINAADADVDFSQYDRDNNGVVDMVYFIVAGNGANYSGNDSRLFWPHRYSLAYYSNIRKDGVRIGDYASSVELYGWTSYGTTTIDGIGTICHEFGHVLGLPDFYDADYEENGSSNHPADWSIMAGGSYFNYGRTPAGYSLLERTAVGFTEPKTITSEGSYTLQSIDASNTGYRITTPVRNETFYIENRQQTKWNAELPGHGMLVFRVDSTNTSVWAYNRVNNNPSHNYYELVRAAGWQGRASANDPFPGGRGVTELNNATTPANLLTWSGEETQWGLTNIQERNGVITFDIEDTYVLKGITVEEELTIGVGISHTMQWEPVPSYISTSVTWKSDNEQIATVDNEGKVTGVAAGTCVIAATTDDGKFSATCKVTVEDQPIVDNIAEFKQQAEGTKCILTLSDAEVLYVHGTDIYIRDATGALVLDNVGLSPLRSNHLNGVLYLQTGTRNKMPIAQPIAGQTDLTAVTVSTGAALEAHEVSFEELTENDYADMVLVKTVELVRDGGVWAVVGDKRARLYGTLGIKNLKVPTDIDNKRFNVTAIFGTNILNGEIIDELYLLKSPEEDTAWSPLPDYVSVDNIAELKEQDNETYVALKLTNAQVIVAEDGDAIIRDATGAVSLTVELSMKENDILNGEVIGLYSVEDGMAYLEEAEGLTNVETITVSEGAEAEPITTTIAELLALDSNEKLLASPLTSNLVVLKECSLAEFMQPFYLASDASSDSPLYIANALMRDDIVVPANIDGKMFDITGVFGHIVDDDIDMLTVILTKSPEVLTGITTVDADDAEKAPVYNLSGQRVSDNYKGVVVRRGRKIVK
ncbi:MAG: M6 family metalloprotease domain-containing protein [Prevotella sp.]|nr:M6 family metalloprotease domain-containing protein [Prevotella sp.]